MVQQNRKLHVAVNQDGAAILDTAAGTLSTLNASGAYIWRALEQGVEVEGIVQAIAQETGAEIASIKEDVALFIDALRQHELLPRPKEAPCD